MSSKKTEVFCDFAICGGGLSGLSLAVKLLENFDKKIVIIEPSDKSNNDRTWSFWAEEHVPFDELVSHQWNQLLFKTFDGHPLSLKPERKTYKLLKSIDFYEHCHRVLSDQVRFIKEPVLTISPSEKAHVVETENFVIRSTYVFDSIPPTFQPNRNDIDFIQHFLGWEIKTEDNVFDPNCATIMDFNIEQIHDCAFVYILPFAPNQALVELTLFSESVLSKNEYEKVLTGYLQKLNTPYKIEQTEYGEIPMTTRNLPTIISNTYFKIGTTGGATVGSTGFTFRQTQAQTDAIVAFLKTKQWRPFRAQRFNWYSNILLDVIKNRYLLANQIFEILFRKNSVDQVLDFLDGKSNLKSEIKIMASLPILPFLKAAKNSIFKGKILF